MTIYSDNLKTRTDFKVVELPFPVFCSMSECNSLMHAGSVAKRFDGATFSHIACPTGAPKHASAHRYSDTGLRFGNK